MCGLECIHYRERKAIGDFQNAANIKSQELASDESRHALLAMLDDLQCHLHTK